MTVLPVASITSAFNGSGGRSAVTPTHSIRPSGTTRAASSMIFMPGVAPARSAGWTGLAEHTSCKMFWTTSITASRSIGDELDAVTHVHGVHRLGDQFEIQHRLADRDVQRMGVNKACELTTRLQPLICDRYQILVLAE